MNVPDPIPTDAIRDTIARYYADRIQQFGATPAGVDWKSAEQQELRFDRLLEVLEAGAGEASLIDLGCGYGALLDLLRARGLGLEYRGVDISKDMVAVARDRHHGTTGCMFTTELDAARPADYAVASGIFNVKLHHPVEQWRAYVEATLDALQAVSLRGFAFNMLSMHSDPERRRADLYYANPCEVFERCCHRFSPRVALLHDYPLYEFTIVVRK